MRGKQSDEQQMDFFQMDETYIRRLMKQTLFGYAFFIGLCLAFCLFLGYSYHALAQVQQEYQHSLLQEELANIRK